MKHNILIEPAICILSILVILSCVISIESCRTENKISQIIPEGSTYKGFIQLYELSELDGIDGGDLSLLTHQQLTQLKPEIFWVWVTLEELTQSTHNIDPKSNSYYHVFTRPTNYNQSN